MEEPILLRGLIPRPPCRDSLPYPLQPSHGLVAVTLGDNDWKQDVKLPVIRFLRRPGLGFRIVVFAYLGAYGIHVKSTELAWSRHSRSHGHG